MSLVAHVRKALALIAYFWELIYALTTALPKEADIAGGGLRSAIYTANGLNQYTERTNPGYYDVIGLASSGASVNINGSSAGVERKGEYFRKELQVNNTSAQYPAVAVEASDGVNTGGPISGHLFVPPATESCTHDEDGNLAQDGRWDYTWDAENCAKN